MPVRLFTYLIGDARSAKYLYQIACSNKGYFSTINSREDAKRKAMEYALVMARPMVLYQQVLYIQKKRFSIIYVFQNPSSDFPIQSFSRKNLKI